MFLNNTLCLIFDTLNSFSNNKKLVIDTLVQSDLFVSTLLIFLLLVSLVLTFGRKGTAIHKVLGLLLTSIFTVFLWIFKTQLLFIYIVYILAFISAVLMLFLSVVMMLPISTISQGTQQVTASSTVLFIGCSITAAFDDIISLMPLFYLVALLFISSFVIFLAQNLKKNTSAFVEPSNAHGSFSIFYNALRKIDLNNYVAKLYTKFNRDTYWSTLQDNMRLGALRAKEYLVNFDVLNKNKLLFNAINWLLVISACILHLVVRCLDLVVTAFLVTIVGLSIRLFNVSVFFKMATKDILDIAQQTYIVAAVVMPFILSILSLPANKELGPFLPRFETVQGIGGIKELLYADFSLFLIFSTVVLLVALFGAAIMTRKHYQNNSLNDQ